MIRLRFARLAFAFTLACPAITASLIAGGCASGPDPLDANSGRVITTGPDDQLTADLFYGKWDLDGQRTNTANGRSGVKAIASDVVKDVTGKGWRFEQNGVMRTDRPIGSKLGSWRIDGRNTLVIKESADAVEQRYEASFVDGYLHLKRTDDIWLVFERDKFFGT